jgi:hypothetical protein
MPLMAIVGMSLVGLHSNYCPSALMMSFMISITPKIAETMVLTLDFGIQSSIQIVPSGSTRKNNENCKSKQSNNDYL